MLKLIKHAKNQIKLYKKILFITHYVIYDCFDTILCQKPSELILRTETIELQPNLNEFINTSSNSSSKYKLLSFHTIPTGDVKASLKSNGVDLLEYVPNNSFIVRFSSLLSPTYLQDKNIKGVYDLPRALKLDYRIIHWDLPHHAIADENNINVAIIAMNGLNVKDYSTSLEQNNIVPYEYGQDIRFAYCVMSQAQVEAVVKMPWVRSIELINEPGKPKSTEGRSLQKSNIINSDLSNGLSYNANGVSLQVRDDGLVGPHIDYQGRLTNLTTDATGTHGDGVAGVMGGAGNIDPTVEGGASGADIYVINYQANFQDNTLSLHQNDDVMITNSSYSNGCNDGYTSTTQTVDRQIIDNPTLMHVFSAGNSNNNDCGYGAGDQWGNMIVSKKVCKVHILSVFVLQLQKSIFWILHTFLDTIHRIIGIGLLLHMVTDFIDCLFMYNQCDECATEPALQPILQSIKELVN